MAIAKRDQISAFINYIGGCSDLIYVDDSGERESQHVCTNGDKVLILGRQIASVFVFGEMFTFEYYKCPNCGKVLLYKY